MTSENAEGAAKMAKRVKVEGKMTFFSDYDKELSKELKLAILDAGYEPENFKDRKMVQPGIFVFNDKKRDDLQIHKRRRRSMGSTTSW
mmetsp:Transcript_473/g.511  ORF Transcript_473/g.511 Transcript_473/m.511 type:complete len:88 (+) Transcript_473:277-540(+)